MHAQRGEGRPAGPVSMAATPPPQRATHLVLAAHALHSAAGAPNCRTWGGGARGKPEHRGSGGHGDPKRADFWLSKEVK